MTVASRFHRRPCSTRGHSVLLVKQEGDRVSRLWSETSCVAKMIDRANDNNQTNSLQFPKRALQYRTPTHPPVPHAVSLQQFQRVTTVGLVRCIDGNPCHVPDRRAVETPEACTVHVRIETIGARPTGFRSIRVADTVATRGLLLEREADQFARRWEHGWGL